MSDKPNIGRAEMDILHYVTEHHPVTVQQVAVTFCQSILAGIKGQWFERETKKEFGCRAKCGLFHLRPEK